MAEINSRYNLDLTQAIAGLQSLQKEVEEFNAATKKSAKAGSDAFKGSARATEQYNSALQKGAQAVGKAAKTNNDLANALKKAATSANEAKDKYSSFTNSAQKGQKGLGDAISNTQKSTGGLSGLLGGLGGVVAGAFAVGAAIDFGKKVIDITTQFQKLKAVLSNALGSNSAGERAFAQIEAFAAKTNFSVIELTESYVKLANRGVIPSVENLQAMADVANTLGKPLGDLNEAILDVSNTERWNELGIKVSKAGDKIIASFKGQTVQAAATEQGALDLITAIGQFEGVAGSTAAISETLGGKISNLGDAFDRMYSLIGDGSNFLISGAVDAIITYMGYVNTALEQVFLTFDQRIKKMAVADNESFIALFRDSSQELRDIMEDNLIEEEKTIAASIKANEARIKMLKETIAVATVAQRPALENKLKAEEEAKQRLTILRIYNEENLDAIDAYYTETEKKAKAAAAKELGIIAKLRQEIKELNDKRETATSVGEISGLNKDILEKQAQLDDLLGKQKKEKAKKDNDELKKLYERLEKDVTDSRIEALEKNSEEYLAAVLQNALKEIDILEEQIKKAEQLEGKDGIIDPERAEQLAILRENIVREYGKRLFDLREEQIKKAQAQKEKELDLDEQIAIEGIKGTKSKGLTEDQEILFERSKQEKILEIQIEYANKRLALLEGVSGKEAELQRAQLQNLITELTSELNSFEKKDKKFDIWKALGLDLSDEQKNAVLDAFGTIKDGVNELLQAQIDASQAIIDQKSQEIEDREKNLDRQIELNKLGFASDVEGEREKIEELKKQRQKALQDQRAAARAKAAVDTVTQLTSLITASANIFAATSAILPPFGQILAISAIGTMFAAFAASKARARAAAPSFRKGGGLQLEGPSHEQKGVHLVNPNTGEKLAEYEGNEYLFAVNKKSTSKYLPLIEAINRDDFSRLSFNDPGLNKMLGELNIVPAPEIPRKAQSYSSQVYDKQQGNISRELQQVRAELAAIKENTSHIPVERREVLPDGSILVKTKNRTTLIRTNNHN